MKLFCALVGVAGSAFPVDVEASETVGQLKELIKAKVSRSVTCDAAELRLYLAQKTALTWLPDEDPAALLLEKGETDAEIRKLIRGYEIRATKTLQYWLFECNAMPAPTVDQLHVLVVVPSPRVAASKKRKLAELKSLVHPSSFAKCHGSGSWVRRLKKLDGQIECHRLVRHDDGPQLPLVLLHPAFAAFDHNCKHIQISNADCEFVTQLCCSMSSPYESESGLAEAARHLLQDYLLQDYGFASISPTPVDGSISSGSYRYGEILLLNLQCKLQKGDGGGDPTMQNVAYYLKCLPRAVDRQYPCLLVDICGPLLSVFGIVNTGDEAAICEPLVMSFPLVYFDSEWLMVALARMCAALKAAVKALTDECIANRGRPLVSVHRLQFPYADSFMMNEARVQLRYLRPVQRFVFLARLDDGTQVIAKLAKRYSTTVHEYCAQAGFAPKLLGYERLVNGWELIVMERLELISLWQADAAGHRETVCRQLLEMQQRLASASFVHGDLRENNVLWDVGNHRVVLIDFDWAGEHRVATYPPFMNTEIAWPEGAACGHVLDIAHDAYWFESLRAHLTRSF